MKRGSVVRGLCTALGKGPPPSRAPSVREAVGQALAASWPGSCDAVDVAKSVSARRDAGVAYQSNAALRAAKPLNRSAPDLAAEVAAGFQALPATATSPVASITTAGPGFLNIELQDAYLMQLTHSAACNSFPPTTSMADRRVLVDFGSPNVGKHLHAGHLRSAVLGDTLCRLLEYAGADVTGVSHVGDLGLPAALVVTQWAQHHADVAQPTVTHLNSWYAAGKQRYEADPEFRRGVEAVLLQLQQQTPGDVLRRWDAVCRLSQRSYGPLFRQLGVVNTERGESMYVADCPGAVQQLQSAGVAHADGDAVVVPLDATASSTDLPPLVIRKSNGAFLYSTVDIVALHRRTHAGFTDLLYVVDVAQSLHFNSLFAVGDALGWTDGVRVEHVAFGLVQGADGRKMSSRAGGDVTLEALLAAGLEATRAAVSARGEQSRLTASEDDEGTLRAICAGAIRYYDLSHQRTKNYAFSHDQALSMKGNTSVFLLYAVARLRALLERLPAVPPVSGMSPWRALAASVPPPAPDTPLHNTERALALAVAQLPDVIDDTTAALAPHVLCDHLFRIAQRFHAFYGACRVVDNDGSPLPHRLQLCGATDAALRLGLGLLGVPVLDRL